MYPPFPFYRSVVLVNEVFLNMWNWSAQILLVNISWSKQKKNAFLMFEESKVDIAAMLNTKKGDRLC